MFPVVTVIMLQLIYAVFASLPPGPGPFGSDYMMQPVAGAQRAQTLDGWKQGKLCDVSKPPYNAVNGTNASTTLQQVHTPSHLWQNDLFLKKLS